MVRANDVMTEACVARETIRKLASEAPTLRAGRIYAHLSEIQVLSDRDGLAVPALDLVPFVQDYEHALDLAYDCLFKPSEETLRARIAEFRGPYAAYLRESLAALDNILLSFSDIPISLTPLQRRAFLDEYDRNGTPIEHAVTVAAQASRISDVDAWNVLLETGRLTHSNVKLLPQLYERVRQLFPQTSTLRGDALTGIYRKRKEYGLPAQLFRYGVGWTVRQSPKPPIAHLLSPTT